MEREGLAVAQAGGIGGGHGEGVVAGVVKAREQLQGPHAVAVVRQAGEVWSRHGQAEHVPAVGIGGREGQGQAAAFIHALIGDGIQRGCLVYIEHLQDKAARVREAAGVGDGDGDGIRASRREAGRKGERSAAVAVVGKGDEGRARQ